MDDKFAQHFEPLKGYTHQSEIKLRQVNWHKVMEERILREIDTLRQGGCDGPVDQRWLAISATKFEEAFMALNRSIMQPRRLDDQAIRETQKSIEPFSQ